MLKCKCIVCDFPFIFQSAAESDAFFKIPLYIPIYAFKLYLKFKYAHTQDEETFAHYGYDPLGVWPPKACIRVILIMQKLNRLRQLPHNHSKQTRPLVLKHPEYGEFRSDGNRENKVVQPTIIMGLVCSSGCLRVTRRGSSRF